MEGSLGVGHEGCKCKNNFGNFGLFCIFGVSVEAFCYNFGMLVLLLRRWVCLLGREVNMKKHALKKCLLPKFLLSRSKRHAQHLFRKKVESLK